MARRSKSTATADGSTAPEGAGLSRAAVKKAARAAAKAEKAASATERAAAKAAAKASSNAAKATRAENAKAAKSAKKAKKAEKAAAVKSFAPVRAAQALADPKLAKRFVTVGKVLAPVVAPIALKAVAGARGYLDNQRAQRLGVPVADLGAYRGPTGAMGARINGLSDSVRDLGLRRGKDLQVTRFVEVAESRLADLTAAVQASASMPRARRSEVLKAVARELDRIDADLVSHLMSRA